MKKHRVLMIVAGLILPFQLHAADQIEQSEAIRKIENAVSQTNLFELSSFQMKARVQVESQGKLVDGTYQLFWAGPEKWREEIAIGYREVTSRSKADP
jgi:hypothetical protein